MEGASNAEQIGVGTSNNFQPSSNFRNMKKYFQYKYEHENREADAVLVQPPLPPDSPPPYPPHFVVKQEVVGNAYENTAQQNTPNPQDAQEAPRKIMCKDFVRGTCNRRSCSFNHEIDLSQLKGIYHFCRDFANGNCQRPKCKFVHATTFEKENFFRTGVLPPETMSHIEDAPFVPMPTIPEEKIPVFPFGEQRSDHHYGYAPQFFPTTSYQPMQAVPPTVAPAAQFPPTMPYEPLPPLPPAVAPAAQFPPTMPYAPLPPLPPAVAPAAQFPRTMPYAPLPPLPPAVAPTAAVSYRPLPPPVAPANTGVFYFAAPQPVAAPMPVPMRVSHEARPAMARTHTANEKRPCINCILQQIRYQQTLSKIESAEEFIRQMNKNIAKLDEKKAQLISAFTKVL